MSNLADPKYQMDQMIKYGDKHTLVIGKIYRIQRNGNQWAYEVTAPAGRSGKIWINEEDIVSE